MLETLFNKVSGLKACNFIKKIFQHRCFSVNIAKFWRTAFFIEHLPWLLLPMVSKIQRLISIYITLTFEIIVSDFVIKGHLRPNLYPWFYGLFLLILWRKRFYKVWWRFDEFSRTYEALKFWIRRKWRHTRHFTPGFLCIFFKF